MKKSSLKNIAISAAMLLTGFSFSSTVSAQRVFESQVMDITLSGTSSLHDWEMKAVKGASKATFSVDRNNKVTGLSMLSFTFPARNLKSKHTVMDNNTYKALNTTKNPNISFILTSATVTPTGGDNYQLNCIGKLTIAGTTRETNLTSTGKYNPADKSFTVTGVKKMKMTDYNVKPPKAMLGTIKTGNDISIAYSIKFTS
jgi:YceI-like domain